MIRSRSNPQVRTIRRLRSSYGRRNADLLLLEGPHLATAAAEAGLTVRHLLVTPDFHVRHAELVDRVEHESGTRAAPIAPERLREQADADAPQGIAAIAEPPRTWKTAESTAPPLDPGLHLYADGIQDPGNLGAMARSAEAAGAASLLLSPGTARASHPRALRASAGSLLRIQLWTDVGVDQLPPDARCLALTPDSANPESPPSVPLFSSDGEPLPLSPTDALILAVGSESRGLSAPLLERADLLLSIPTVAAVQSLNATVAASLALFELRRLLD
ncbi:MAG: RNA methyltransferase [Holophagales bacterium]|nr:RNA methyltransferase [Holophagales bacterium]MYG30127.1 RNA methyltransferase [Holophagales bacterium]MYI80845.1 RNA methyltransferase [Holophagales bacterium]